MSKKRRISFTSISIIFAISELFLFAIILFLQLSFFIMLMPVAIYLLFTIWGSANIQSNFYIKSINNIKTNEKNIFLTFDDGPEPDYTRKIIKTLEKYNAKATFFCIGIVAKKYPELVLEIIDAGHEIGNHSFTHTAGFPLLSTKNISKEISDTNNILIRITGKKPIFFRPPFGVTNPNIAKSIKQNLMNSAGWSIRSMDTVKTPKKVLNRLKNVKSGDIILFHDNRKFTNKILEDFLRSVKDENYKFLSLSEGYNNIEL